MNPPSGNYGRKRVKKTRPGMPQAPDSSKERDKKDQDIEAIQTENHSDSQPSLNLIMPQESKTASRKTEDTLVPEVPAHAVPDSEQITEIRPATDQPSKLEEKKDSVVERAQNQRSYRDKRPERDNRRSESFRQNRSARSQSDINKEPGSQFTKPKPRRFGPDKSKTRVSIIIPAYNEEGNIKPLMDQFHEVIVRAGNDWEVILVDDGSSDKTADRARDASIHYHWLRVISYPVNRGLTDALNTGFQNARGSIYVFYPADLQYHPQDIPKMINRIDRGADVVTGWKQGKYHKRFVSFVYNYLCRALFKLKVHDLNSVKAFKKDVLEKVNLRRDWHRYLVVLAADQGFNVDEVKVNVYPRHSGKSKFGTGRILGGVLDLLSVKFQISFTKKPLRFFGTWGLVSILLGFLTGLVAIYLRFFTDHGSRVWLYLVILFILSGLMLFSLGFLAEVIVALREEIESMKSKK